MGEGFAEGILKQESSGARTGIFGYIVTMNQQVRDILRQVASWPEENQEELAAVAREIQSRRTGVYTLSDDERAAIADARKGGFASEQEVMAFWKRHGLA